MINSKVKKEKKKAIDIVNRTEERLILAGDDGIVCVCDYYKLVPTLNVLIQMIFENSSMTKDDVCILFLMLMFELDISIEELDDYYRIVEKGGK